MTNTVVDVVVPVYSGLDETRRCVDSVLASHCETPFELILINDASPEAELVEWLRTIAGQPGVTLLENEVNRGFVGTVNRGMGEHGERDVVLLNSDTEVAPGWLDRLQRCAYADKRTGTATPFANNATICSYPRFCEDNELPPGWDLRALDALFARVNAGERTELVTAVGFCMYIRRACLNAVGEFDEARFGRGYGEENEFCLRARSAGWRHQLAADCFLYHAGAVSFGTMSNTRQSDALSALLELHPDYEARVARFIRRDSPGGLRRRADIARLTADRRPVVLHFGHALGGGAARHLNDLGEVLADQVAMLVLEPVQGARRRLRLRWNDPAEGFAMELVPGKHWEELVALLRMVGVQRVHFQHLLGLPAAARELPAKLGVPYDVTLHDFYFYCPQVHLQDRRGAYCGEPDVTGCRACVQQRPAPGGLSIEAWRADSATFLEGAARVFAPSEAVRSRMQTHFPAVEPILAPHPEPRRALECPITAPPLEEDQPLRIAVIGALSEFKGADLLEQTARLATKQQEPLQFTLVGFGYRPLAVHPQANLVVTGPYEESSLPGWLARITPHIVWFPAQVPETYSYTLSACLYAGLPVVVTELGALPERVTGRPWSWVRPANDGPMEALAFFREIRRRNFLHGAPPAVPQTVVAEAAQATFDYTAHYAQPLRRSMPTARLAAVDGAAISDQLRRLTPKRRRLRALAELPLGLLVRFRHHVGLSKLFRHLPSPLQARIRNWVLGGG